MRESLQKSGSEFIDLVLIALGTNDFLWGAKTTAEESRDQLAALVSLVEHADPPRLAVLATVPQIYVTGAPKPQIVELNKLITGDRTRFRFVVDFHAIAHYPEDYSDPVHLSVQGQQKRAEAAFRYLTHRYCPGCVLLGPG